MSLLDRIGLIKGSTNLTGLDFVHVLPTQTELWVYFHRDPATLADPFSVTPIDIADVTIIGTSGGESIPEVTVLTVVQDVDPSGLTIVRITTATPGDSSLYRLTIGDPRVDLFFKSLDFSFKSACPTKPFECLPEPEACALAGDQTVDIDTTARDFTALRDALVSFAGLRSPGWQEPIEADAAVMFMEVMAALGDELAYIQDRYAREAHLASASQRRSLRRLVRLIDYELHDGRSGSTWLQLTVDADTSVDAGSRVWAASEDGAQIGFEVGHGLDEALAAPVVAYEARLAWNALAAYTFDGAVDSYPAGTTSLYLDNTTGVTAADWIGKTILLRTDPADPGELSRRHLVVITSAENRVDALHLDRPLLYLEWSAEHALPLCLAAASLTARGNMLPATAGERVTDYVQLRGSDPTIAQAIERQGPRDGATGERALLFRHSLATTETAGLGFLGADLRRATPELRVARVITPGEEEVLAAWEYRRTLLNSLNYEEHYTLEDGSWRRVVGYQRSPAFGDFAHIDYASADGFTVRFGDGEFGVTPSDGSTFRIDYRTGPATASNVAADVLRHFGAGFTNVTELTNPLPVTDGVDPETAEELRQLAPAAFREQTYRAVRTEDYCGVAAELPWVEHAGARARWTGSWTSVFVTPDPQGTFLVAPARRAELEDRLDCRKQAGREVHVLDPRYRPVDLEILLCVAPGHPPSEVRDRVLTRLRGDGQRRGYFDPDTLTFGTPIYRLTLEAALRQVRGVRAVKGIWIAARGIHERREMELVYRLPDNQILRLANDPRFPERGSVKVITEGV